MVLKRLTLNAKGPEPKIQFHTQYLKRKGFRISKIRNAKEERTENKQRILTHSYGQKQFLPVENCTFKNEFKLFNCDEF